MDAVGERGVGAGRRWKGGGEVEKYLTVGSGSSSELWCIVGTMMTRSVQSTHCLEDHGEHLTATGRHWFGASVLAWNGPRLCLQWQRGGG